MFNTFKRIVEMKQNSIKNKTLMLVDDKDRAIIDIGAENYDDLYSPFCLYDRNVLDFELEDYLDNKNKFVPIDYDLHLIFHVTDANLEKQQEIESTVKQNYESRINDTNRKMIRNAWFSFLMLMLGIATLLLYYFCSISNCPLIITAICDMASWVFTWTAVDSFMLERRALQIEKIMSYRMVKAVVEAKDFIPKWAKIQLQKQANATPSTLNVSAIPTIALKTDLPKQATQALTVIPVATNKDTLKQPSQVPTAGNVSVANVAQNTNGTETKK